MEPALLSLLSAAPLIFACHGDGKGEDPTGRDADQDGYVSVQDGGDDCDDGDRAVNPGAREQCNDRDDDCDGEVDEDLDSVIFYADTDGDGHGDPATGEAACRAPIGAVPVGDDCDDAHATAYPGRREICDQLDNDCDGVTDDVDDDEDGYVSESCGGDDCNDRTDKIHPGREETWYDGVDSDCDGWSDYDADHDGYNLGDLPGVSDCDDQDDAVNPSAEEICHDGRDNDCDGSAGACRLGGELSTADAAGVVRGEGLNDEAGTLSAGLPTDIDGDGLHDLILGAARTNYNATRAGAAFVVFGPLSAEVSLEAADVQIAGAKARDEAGTGAAGLGDLDGDGYGELLVTAPGQDSGATDAGAAYLLYGPLSGYGTLDLYDARMLGDNRSDALHVVAGLGDVDGDGAFDFALGAPSSDDPLTDGGAVYLLVGPQYDDDQVGDLAWGVYTGDGAGDLAGTAIAAAGDATGDGVEDFLVGAPGNDTWAPEGGAAYLLSYPKEDVADLDHSAQCRFYSASDGDALGAAVAGPGDLNGDGTDDLAIGASGSDLDGEDAGAVFIFRGGALVGGEMATSAWATVLGSAPGDAAGASLARTGDLDHDGYADLAIGAPGSDAGGAEAGAVYLLYGPLSGTVRLEDAEGRILGEAAGDLLGATGLLGVGDSNGDSFGDLLVGSTANDSAGASAGAAWLFLGDGL